MTASYTPVAFIQRTHVSKSSEGAHWEALIRLPTLQWIRVDDLVNSHAHVMLPRFSLPLKMNNVLGAVYVRNPPPVSSAGAAPKESEEVIDLE